MEYTGENSFNLDYNNKNQKPCAKGQNPKIKPFHVQKELGTKHVHKNNPKIKHFG